MKDQEILTQINKEKHRRRMQYYRLCLAFGLILCLIYYIYYQIQIQIPLREKLENSCYSCGLYDGKQCEQIYYTEQDKLLGITPQEKLQQIAEYNEKKWPKERYLGGQFGDSLNDFLLKGLNNSTNSSVIFNVS